MKIQDEAVAGAVAMERLAEGCRAVGLDPDVALGRAQALMSETPWISTERAIQLVAGDHRRRVGRRAIGPTDLLVPI